MCHTHLTHSPQELHGSTRHTCSIRFDFATKSSHRAHFLPEGSGRKHSFKPESSTNSGEPALYLPSSLPIVYYTSP